MIGPLRIVHADTDDLDNPLRGGQPVRTHAINSRLAQRHRITVATAVYDGCHRRMTRGRVKYRRLGLHAKSLGLSPHLSFLACLGPWVARQPHDLAVEEFTPPVGFCGLPWWTHKPVVSMVQWFFFDAWEERYHLPFNRWMKQIAVRNRYRWFIVQSNAMGRTIGRLIPGAVVRKIPCGLDDAAFTVTNNLGDYALFLGRLDIRQKGLDLLLNAWAGVCSRKKIPLIIAGEGPDRKRLDIQLRNAGLGALVTFVGRIEGQEKRDLLESCRFLVMPSREETFGLTALEAMGSSKPVIAFDIPNLNELVQNQWGVLVAPGDAASFGCAVRNLWSRPDLCREYGWRAYQEARNYRWDVLAGLQEAFYLEVLDGQIR